MSFLYMGGQYLPAKNIKEDKPAGHRCAICHKAKGEGRAVVFTPSGSTEMHHDKYCPSCDRQRG